MALDIIGTNETFDAFVKFAEAQHVAGKEKAVARIDVGDIAKRDIRPASGDWVGVGAGRLASLKRANNITRDAFMKAVCEMFGGVDHIPDNVKDAMKLQDYGKGKPLTARRILAVAEAIKNLDLEGEVLSKGYTKDEVATMHEVADLYAKATGSNKVGGFIEVSTLGSAANRLMNYGGRFLESVENFKNGLALIDSFKSWFSGVGEELDKLDVKRTRTDNMNKTMLNASVSSFQADKLAGTEKFVFESIAHDYSFDLAERDNDKLFGMDNNPATKFFGLNLNDACTQTIAQIPPEKRNTLFSAISRLYPLAKDAKEANDKPLNHGSLTNGESKTIIARILRNFDKVDELERNGDLTLTDLVKLCFPELPEDAEGTVKEVAELIDDANNEITAAYHNGRIPLASYGQVLNAFNELGCSVEEAMDWCDGGPQPQPPEYLATGTLGLASYDGTTKEGRRQLMTDLGRPANYNYVWNSGKGLLPKDTLAFTFNFPGDQTVATGWSDEGKKNIEVVCDKVEELCGKAHPAQASSVMTMLSQSGISILIGGLAQYNVQSNEHSACDFTLSKDDKTGDVTIRYSSPEGLPFGFEWTANIRSDGFVTTTPLQFIDKRTPEQKQLNGLGLFGDAAQDIADIILPGSGLEEVKDPVQEYKTRAHKITVAQVQTYAASSISKVRPEAKGSAPDLNRYPDTYERDFNRKFNVTLGKGEPLWKLGNMEKARDEYVAFITDGKVKTYAKADDKTKMMAFLLMSFSSQGILSPAITGVSKAFGSNGNTGRLYSSHMPHSSGTKTDTINISKDKDGNIVLKARERFDSDHFALTKPSGASSMYWTGKDGYSEYRMNVVITKESFEQFATANWKDFDNEKIDKIEFDPNIEHSVERAADELPPEFKLDFKVDVSFNIAVDELKEVN